MVVIFKIITIIVLFTIIIFTKTVIEKIADSIKKPSQKNKYFTRSIIKFFIMAFFVSFFGFVMLLNHFNDNPETKKADGFTIESYHVSLNVHEDAIVDVKEEITVSFYEVGHHGIYKITPYWLKYTGQDGKTMSRKSEISDLIALGENYTVDQVGGKAQIKIGDPNVTLPIGTHTYTITYTYDMGGDPYSDFDEFIFHTFGDYWGTEIKNASLKVTMPKTFDQTNIHFFADKYRKKDISDSVNYYVIGNTLYADVSANYELMKSLTVDIALPEGYFMSGSNNYGITAITFGILIFILTIIAFIIWYHYGKDLHKVSQTVEFYPPENYDASEIGYLYKDDVGSTLSVSLIVSLASKDYIKIDESENLTKIINLCPIELKEFERIIKVRKADNFKMIKHSDKRAIKKLFGNQSHVDIVNDSTFYHNYINLITKGYIQIESDTLYDSIETTYHKKSLSINEKLIYQQLFQKANENVLSEDSEFYHVFRDISTSLSNQLNDIIYDTTSYKKMNRVSNLFVVAGIFWICMISVEDLNPRYFILYTIAFGALILIAAFMFLMKRKTSYGEQILSKIKGFRNYLETAEKNRINQLVEENPNYFYDILPYAYVLNVSKKWIEKFENIPMPEKEKVDFDYSKLDRLNNSIYIPSSSSGSSSSSGGCSSCGGGCSSCGGGGSW